MIKKQEMTLSPNPNNKNKIPTTSTRKGNLDNEITFKKINNVNNKNLQQNRASDIYDNKKTTRHLLKKKNPSFNNFIDRAKTPTSKYINKNSSKVLSNKSKLTNEKKNDINYNNRDYDIVSSFTASGEEEPHWGIVIGNYYTVNGNDEYAEQQLIAFRENGEFEG